MNGRNLYSYLFIWLCIAGLVSRSFAQTITIGSIAPASVCPGEAVTISYAISGTFAAGNTFTAQLSDATGAFTAPASIGSVTSTSAGSVNATIPATTANGAGYRIRIVSSAPAATGAASSQVFTVNVASPPGTSPAPPYCQNAPAVALVATPSAGGTLYWYNTAETGGTASTTPTIPNTSQPGTVNYYVSQVVNSCQSPRTPIPVTVNPAPNAPAVSSFGVCQNASATLTATPASGGTLNWYGTNATGGTPSGTAPTPPTSAIGSITYYVSQSINGCEGPRAGLTVTVNAIPAAPGVTPPGAYCQNAPAAALVASGTGSLNWYGTAATGGTPSAVAPVPSTAAAGVTTYYVSQSINGCESPRAAISVTVNPSPSEPSTIPAPAYCQNTPAVALIATPSTGGTLNWYGNAATGGTPSAVAPVPNTAVPSTFSYYVSQTVNGCEGPRAAIPVTVKAIPSPPTFTVPGPYCQNAPAAALVATSPANGLILWYGTAATGGTSSVTAPIPPTTAVGAITYYVSQSVNGCEGARAAITVTVNAIPAAPGATLPGVAVLGTVASDEGVPPVAAVPYQFKEPVPLATRAAAPAPWQ